MIASVNGPGRKGYLCPGIFSFDRPVRQIKSWITRMHITDTIDRYSVIEFDKAIPFYEIPGPKGFKFLGTIHYYMSGKLNRYKYREILTSYFDQYGPIFKETLFDKTTVHIYQPEMIRRVYHDEGKYPVIAPLIEASQKFRKEENIALGLGNTNGEAWYKLRSAVQPYMMKPTEVSSYLPQVNEVTNEFVENIIRDGYCDNFLPEAAKWYLENTGYIAFGKRMQYLKTGTNSEKEAILLFEMNDQTFTIAHDLKFCLPFFKLFSTTKYKAFRQSEKYYTEIARSYLLDTVKTINKELQGGKDIDEVQNRYRFVLSLCSQRNMSFDDAGIITLSLFSDGLRATVPILCALMYCLATNERTQDVLYEEINRVIGKRSYISAEDLSKMKYVKACVMETLRLYPNNLDVSRITQNDIILGNYQIPSGTHINLNNFYLYRSKDLFPEPNSFVPERWLRGAKHTEVDPYIVLPFGRGPRMCIGRRFAEQDMYVAISKILQKSRIHWKGNHFGQQCKILMYPEGQIKFQFEKR